MSNQKILSAKIITPCTWPCQMDGCQRVRWLCPAFTASLQLLQRARHSPRTNLHKMGAAGASPWRPIEWIILCQMYSNKTRPISRRVRQWWWVINNTKNNSTFLSTVFLRLSRKTKSGLQILECLFRVLPLLKSNNNSSNNLQSRVSRTAVDTGCRVITRQLTAAPQAPRVPHPLLRRSRMSRGRKPPLRPTTGSGQSTLRGSSAPPPSPCLRYSVPSNWTVSFNQLHALLETRTSFLIHLLVRNSNVASTFLPSFSSLHYFCRASFLPWFSLT